MDQQQTARRTCPAWGSTDYGFRGRDVIGVGSLVTRDVPVGVLAAGNPCRVVRDITE
jgi:hypothetical protein